MMRRHDVEHERLRRGFGDIPRIVENDAAAVIGRAKEELVVFARGLGWAVVFLVGFSC